MKNLSSIIVLLFCISSTYAQIGINLDGSAPHSSAILDVKSTTKAFYPPRMNTGAKEGIVGVQTGALVYDVNAQDLNFFTGSLWLNVGRLNLPVLQFGTSNSSDGLFSLTNNSLSGFTTGIRANIQGDQGFGVVGNAYKTNPTLQSIGVAGFNSSTNANGMGVYGEHTGNGVGVSGKAFGATGVGVKGVSQGSTGVGVYGLSGNGTGVEGRTTNNGIAVKGTAQNGGFGVYGDSDTGFGVYGVGGYAGGHFSSSSSSNTTSDYALVTTFGKVGLGSYAPNLNVDERVDINGRLRIRNTESTAGVWFNNSGNSINYLYGAFYGMKIDTETGIFIGGAWRFWVNDLGNATLTGTLTQSSDRRLKKYFSLLNNSLSDIYKLNGYHYKWIEESRSQDLQTGLIAQEVQKIFPELVQTDEKGFLSVNYIGLIPHLIESVKELRNENINLKSDNAILNKRLDKIEAILFASNPSTGK